jgi:hypothetical protein
VNAPLDQIARAVEESVGYPVKHRKHVFVSEGANGKTAWEGSVEVFDVESPVPGTAYGWAVEGKFGPQFVAMLGRANIDSPLAAVRVWLACQVRKTE